MRVDVAATTPEATLSSLLTHHVNRPGKGRSDARVTPLGEMTSGESRRLPPRSLPQSMLAVSITKSPAEPRRGAESRGSSRPCDFLACSQREMMLWHDLDITTRRLRAFSWSVLLPTMSYHTGGRR